MEEQLIDHLFRHQFGKMVSILTRYFGFEHLESIEDAVQDTFIKAIHAWKNKIPENPEAWLTAAAKNRAIDLMRSLKSEKARSGVIYDDHPTDTLNELFLENEIADSQLRMIFTACHPLLDPKDQIAFALKTISGFSIKEIAAALMSQSQTIKKRLQRARKLIAQKNVEFEIPFGEELTERMDRVLEVIYVIFNEGFHSNKKEMIIRKDLCGEAMRLCKMMIEKEPLRSPKLYALFALMCFHSARLDSKINDQNELIPLAEQDRTKWYFPLIALGNDAMNKATKDVKEFSSYHYEAAIAFDHLRAPNFETTDWNSIAEWHEQLLQIQPNVNTSLNLAAVYLQMKELAQAYTMLLEIDPKLLVQNEYLYYSTFAEYYHLSGDAENAMTQLSIALEMVEKESERKYLKKKASLYKSQ